MGIMSFLGKQFIDVIEWTESVDGVLAYRYPMRDQEIQTGAKLTVRESQMAAFVNEGRVADVFNPGLHTLNTQTIPLLTNLMHWDKAFASPFKSDVYFFSTREQLDQKWGTPQAITVRDKTYGIITLRAFGNYSYRVSDPATLMKLVSGTRDTYTAGELEGQLRGAVLSSIASHLGSADVPFIDMAANQNVFSESLTKVLEPVFAGYGLQLSTFFVQSITLPEEVQQYLNKSMSMNILGDLKRYTQFQVSESVPAAAANPGGLASIGAGLGAGVAMGQTMSAGLGGVIGGTTVPMSDPFATLEKLHGLLQKGIISQQEFDTKKAELLRSINS